MFDYDVIREGAHPDGSTDDTKLFQQLLDRAGEAGGGVVYVPAGHYRIEAYSGVVWSSLAGVCSDGA